MTKTEINLAIGKVCGWEPCEPRVFLRHAPSHAFIKDGNYYGGLNSIPNYCEDLNAMHEAENSLELWQHEIFRDELAALVAPTGRHWKREHFHALRPYVSASARQRAEAFLRTLNLWENEHSS